MTQVHEVNRGKPHARKGCDAYLLLVKADLLHHLAALSALLARSADSVALSPELVSELHVVKSMVDIYCARSAEDLEDARSGFAELDLS